MIKLIYSESYLRSITLKKIIQCNILDLWKVISKESNLELFHPYCLKNDVIKWGGINSEDELEYLNGRKMKRKFVSWCEGIGYDLFIYQIGKPSSFVSWRISTIQNASVISITIFPYLMNKNNKVLMFIPFYGFIYPLLKSYLNAVLNGLEFYIMNKKLVQKNQFGKHIWFS